MVSYSYLELTVTFYSLVPAKACASCRTRRTPLWRDAEDGTPLCNACGIRYVLYVWFVMSQAPSYTFPGQALLSSQPAFCAHNFAYNLQQPFLNQGKEEIAVEII